MKYDIALINNCQFEIKICCMYIAYFILLTLKKYKRQYQLINKSIEIQYFQNRP